MKTREEVIKKENFKQCFLMAWLHYLSYKELEEFDLLEAYGAELKTKHIRSSAEWDKAIIPYTEDNLKSGLCILMYDLYSAIIEENWVMGSIYANDVQVWLWILDDEEFSIVDTLSPEVITDYFNKVSKKYKIEF